MPTPLRMTRGPGHEHGGIVVGWLSRLVVVLAAAGLVTFDAVSVGVTRLGAADAAMTAAARARTSWADDHERDRAYAEALAAARVGDAGTQVPPDRFRIGEDGVVQLVVRRTARTVLLGHVGPLRRWADVEASGSATPRA